MEELLPLVRGRLDVEICDIDSRPDWREKYDIRIPVVEFDNRPICQYSLDRPAISRLLESLSAESGE